MHLNIGCVTTARPVEGLFGIEAFEPTLLLQCMSPVLAVRPEGANHQWSTSGPKGLSRPRGGPSLHCLGLTNRLAPLPLLTGVAFSGVASSGLRASAEGDALASRQMTAVPAACEQRSRLPPRTRARLLLASRRAGSVGATAPQDIAGAPAPVVPIRRPAQARAPGSADYERRGRIG
jgi:hypothetical protein